MFATIYRIKPPSFTKFRFNLIAREVPLSGDLKTMSKTKDQDCFKGAVEGDGKEQDNTSMAGQLGHRDQDPLLKSSDTDFPEPGENPEHSGEPEEPRRCKSA